MSRLIRFLADLGALRLLLALAALLAVAGMPPPATPVSYQGWGLVHTLVMPVLAPMVFVVLMLDVLMSRVFMASAEGPARRRYRDIMLTELLLGVLILVRFVPYILALGR